jgi:tRNA (cmo5U34)-methyltransferase
VGNQWHFDPNSYLAMVRSEIRDYDELQAFIAEATESIDVLRVLDLGSGTGVTARAVIDRHPHAELIGVDANDEMLSHARRLVPDATFVVGRLEDALPEGLFDVVVSAFAIHHLDDEGKADLYRRIANSLRIGGRFVICDVVVPESPVDDAIPLEDGIDQPALIRDQLDWLRAAGLFPTVLCKRGDRAVVTADRLDERAGAGGSAEAE